MTTMRAKLRIASIQKSESQENLRFVAVGPANGYPADGSDEDNSFAKWTPNLDLTMSVLNPALLGKFEVDQVFYVDFTPV